MATEKRIKNDRSRLVLGTAQLGMPYGIANKTGQPDLNSAIAIIETAWQGGIRQFDTAQGYGDSEMVLGKALQVLGITNQAKITTKLDPSLDYSDWKSVENSINRSLDNLKIPSLHCLMMHREEMIDHFHEGIIDTLNNCVDKGLIQYVGISVYSPSRAIQAMKHKSVKVIQLPANILDHRFRAHGVFRLAEQKDVSVYIRSIFLQGLILSSAAELPERIKSAKAVIENLELFCLENRIRPDVLAISYIKRKYPSAYIIFGAESVKQVEENMVNWEYSINSEMMRMVESRFSEVDERIVNPVCWNN